MIYFVTYYIKFSNLNFFTLNIYYLKKNWMRLNRPFGSTFILHMDTVLTIFLNAYHSFKIFSKLFIIFILWTLMDSHPKHFCVDTRRRMVGKVIIYLGRVRDPRSCIWVKHLGRMLWVLTFGRTDAWTHEHF